MMNIAVLIREIAMLVHPSLLLMVAAALLFTLLGGCRANHSINLDRSPHSESAGPIPTIKDAQAYAADYFQRTYGPVELAAYHDDLNVDGRPDLLIANLASTGQAGMAHLLFLHTESGYQLLGELFMHRDSYRVLMPAEDGRPRLVYASTVGAGQTAIAWVVARDGVFIVEKQEIIHAGDSGDEAGRRRWAQVFGR